MELTKLEMVALAGLLGALAVVVYRHGLDWEFILIVVPVLLLAVSRRRRVQRTTQATFLTENLLRQILVHIEEEVCLTDNEGQVILQNFKPTLASQPVQTISLPWQTGELIAGKLTIKSPLKIFDSSAAYQ